MPVPFEVPERKAMRKSLRSLERHITGLEPDHQIQMVPSELDQVQFLPMVLDEGANDKPAYFSSFPASFFQDPDDEFDKENDEKYPDFYSWPEDDEDDKDEEYDHEDYEYDEDDKSPFKCARLIEHYFSCYSSGYYYSEHPTGGEIVWSFVPTRSGRVYKNLDRYKYPEFEITSFQEVREGPFAHLKTSICNDLNADDDHLLQGELLPILRLMIGHMRRARFIKHMVAPVMAFSFVGPQHARVIEAYMDGHTVVVRPTKLYDLRTKDVAALKTFAQWYYGKPRAPTGPSK